MSLMPLSYLYSLQHFGIKLGLENIQALCAALGDPQRQWRAIHIAGTNGKGSTAAACAAILQESGVNTGLYTSPHLVRFHERIRINGRTIPDTDLIRWVERLRPHIEERRATFFEATTALAFAWFAEQGVDVAVVETGLGGRWDATNLLRPDLTIITSIGLDHTEYLGSTLAAIASEKAGILKAGVPCITAVDQPEARAVIEERARELGVTVYDALPACSTPRCQDLEDMAWEVELDGEIRTVHFPYIGAHQVRNVGLALAAGRVLAERGWTLTTDQVLSGLARTRLHTGLVGRLSRFAGPPRFVFDVGHNPAGIAVTLSAYEQVCDPSRTHLVFGLLGTKDAASVVAVLVTRPWKSVTVVQARSSEARPAQDLAYLLATHGVSARAHGTVIAGLRDAEARRGSDDEIFVLGSHYVIGDVLEDLGWNESMDKGV